jgi:hypothetical protein
MHKKRLASNLSTCYSHYDMRNSEEQATEFRDTAAGRERVSEIMTAYNHPASRTVQPRVRVNRSIWGAGSSYDAHHFVPPLTRPTAMSIVVSENE